MIVNYLETHHVPILICVSLQLGAMIPLGLFTASAVSRLQFLGVNAAGTYIALFGGFLTVFDGVVAASTLWAAVHAGVAAEAGLLTAMYYLSYALGGPGFSVPMGLLIAGICVPAAIFKLLPKWLVVFGFLLAVAGELSWLNLVFPQALFLIPLVRFPGFVWLIAAGFALPKTKTTAAPVTSTATA